MSKVPINTNPFNYGYAALVGGEVQGTSQYYAKYGTTGPTGGSSSSGAVQQMEETERSL